MKRFLGKHSLCCGGGERGPNGDTLYTTPSVCVCDTFILFAAVHYAFVYGKLETGDGRRATADGRLKDLDAFLANIYMPRATLVARIAQQQQQQQQGAKTAKQLNS